MATPFAEVTDLSKGWRALTTQEAARAADLLEKASRQVRAERPSVDDRIAAGTLDPDLVGDVVCDMVRRAIIVPVDQQPVTQFSEGTGPFSQSITYSNPDGNLYLSKNERRRLGLIRQRASSVETATYDVG